MNLTPEYLAAVARLNGVAASAVNWRRDAETGDRILCAGDRPAKLPYLCTGPVDVPSQTVQEVTQRKS